jgi:hypothetical protein
MFSVPDPDPLLLVFPEPLNFVKDLDPAYSSECHVNKLKIKRLMYVYVSICLLSLVLYRVRKLNPSSTRMALTLLKIVFSP